MSTAFLQRTEELSTIDCELSLVTGHYVIASTLRRRLVSWYQVMFGLLANLIGVQEHVSFFSHVGICSYRRRGTSPIQ
jgi:hypothetical protein